MCNRRKASFVDDLNDSRVCFANDAAADIKHIEDCYERGWKRDQNRVEALRNALESLASRVDDVLPDTRVTEPAWEALENDAKEYD